jgi:hypothetical protein
MPTPISKYINVVVKKEHLNYKVFTGGITMKNALFVVMLMVIVVMLTLGFGVNGIRAEMKVGIKSVFVKGA